MACGAVCSWFLFFFVYICRYSGLGGKDGVDFAAKLKAIREKREVRRNKFRVVGQVVATTFVLELSVGVVAVVVTPLGLIVRCVVRRCVRACVRRQALEAKEAHREQQRKELREEAAKLRKEAEAVRVRALRRDGVSASACCRGVCLLLRWGSCIIFDSVLF